MRSMLRSLSFLALLGFVAVARGGDDTSEGDKSNEVQVVFANGSSVRLTLLQENIEVATRYGPLSVPVKDIQRIEFGVRLPAMLEKKVDLAARKLASPVYTDREMGERELLSSGPLVYPTVLRTAKSPDQEVSRRAGKVVVALREKYAEKELRPARGGHYPHAGFRHPRSDHDAGAEGRARNTSATCR